MTEWDKMLDDEPLMQRTVEAFFRDILDLIKKNGDEAYESAPSPNDIGCKNVYLITTLSFARARSRSIKHEHALLYAHLITTLAAFEPTCTMYVPAGTLNLAVLPSDVITLVMSCPPTV